MRSRFHLKKRIDFLLREIEEKGLRYKFLYDSSLTLQKEMVNEEENVIVLDVYSLHGVFILWIMGCSLSSVVFLGELILKFLLKDLSNVGS